MWQQICAADGIPTPYLALDYQRLPANLEQMAVHVHGLGGRLWPHLKTHKSREITRLQAKLGAGGATVATLAEARMAIDCGLTDVLIAYPPVPAAKARGHRAVGRDLPPHLTARGIEVITDEHSRPGPDRLRGRPAGDLQDRAGHRAAGQRPGRDPW